MAFKQQQDYLACVMDAQVSNAVYQLNQRMDDDRISNFNQAVAAVLSLLNENCPAHNCINASTIAPSQRNQIMNATCVTAYQPTVANVCDPRTKTIETTRWMEGRWIKRTHNVTVGWDPMDIVLCQGVEKNSGDTYDGVCGGDGWCYHSDVGFKGTKEFYKQLKVLWLAL